MTKGIYMKRIICALFSLALLLPFCGCETTALSNESDPIALAIVLGRHANTNAFPEVYYQQLLGDIERAVYGGHISVIISDGDPREVKITDSDGSDLSFEANANNKTILEKRVSERTDSVMNFLKDEAIKAIAPENDLLQAIKEARASLNNPAIPANIEKRIIILDSCVSTAGDLKMQDMSLSMQSSELMTIVAELSEAKGVLPDLKDVNVRIIGLGDVAKPQEIDDETKLYLKSLWKEILISCGAIMNDLDILVSGIGGQDGIVSGNVPNESKRGISSDNSYPFVTVVDFTSHNTVSAESSSSEIELEEESKVTESENDS
jgi:hypothetical protein